MGWIIAIGIAVVALLVWGAINAHRQALARRTALGELARSWGLSFAPEKRGDPQRRFPGLAWFRQGDDRWLTNSMSGLAEVAGRQAFVQAGDFTYETRDTDTDGDRRTRTYHHSYFLIDLDLPAPSLAVRPEGFGDKVKGFFGFRDLEFESAEFNAKFHVRASDKKFAYDVLHARAQEALMRAPFTELELAEGVLLVPGSDTWTPDQFARARAFAAEFLAGWPAFVWDGLARPRAPQ